jgi:PKD repeat protein
MNRSSRALALFAVAALCALALAACAVFSPAPSARFDVSPVVVYAGDTITLSAAPSTGDLVDYRWSIDGGAAEFGRQVTTSFAEPGIHVVLLTVEDAEGRTASDQTEIAVYARSGTRLFFEDFSDGASALGRWPLDPAWASPTDSNIEFIAGQQGYVLYVHSGDERLNRRAAPVTLPPLRVGQRFVFSFRVMTLQNQDAHTFVIAPARSSPDLPAAGLPYYLFSNALGGSSMREPSPTGIEVGHPLAFTPSVYLWHDYEISYTSDEYSITIDGLLWQTGPISADLSRGGTWWIVLGDESSTEACLAYYDDITVTVEE